MDHLLELSPHIHLHDVQLTLFPDNRILVCFKSKLSQSSDLFGSRINYYSEMFTFDLSLNLPDITIYITTMFYLLTIFCKNWIMEFMVTSHKSKVITAI